MRLINDSLTVRAVEARVGSAKFTDMSLQSRMALMNRLHSIDY
jgi:hypothetical protein